MVTTCCAYGCKERALPGTRVSFHSFPKNEERRKLWLKQVRRENLPSVKNAKVCSNHFTPDSFDREKFGGTWLKNDAVPTLFDFPPDMETSEMPNTCCVKYCRGNYDKNNKVHVFSFPRNEDLKLKWMKSIYRTDLVVTKNTKVCQRHFKAGDIQFVTTFYKESTGETLTAKLKIPRLKEGAIPIIFPAPDNKSVKGQKLSKCKGEKLPKKNSETLDKEEKCYYSSSSTSSYSDDEDFILPSTSKNQPIQYPRKPSQRRKGSFEHTFKIKKEPVDEDSNPSTSNEEFFLPHEDDSWTTSDSVVEPQFTLSVASLNFPSAFETSDGEQMKKKRKTDSSRIQETVAKDRMEDNIQFESIVKIKEEPVDYYPFPSTSHDTVKEGFSLPNEKNLWTTSNSRVEPQFTLSVASLALPDEHQTSDGEQLEKRPKHNPSRIEGTFVKEEKDFTPFELTVNIKKEPVDYCEQPDAPGTAKEEFILPN